LAASHVAHHVSAQHTIWADSKSGACCHRRGTVLSARSCSSITWGGSVPGTHSARPRRATASARPGTITYLFAGEIVHRDSTGCAQVIRRRSELDDCRARHYPLGAFRLAAEGGGLLHGIQAWIALPLAAKADRRFTTMTRDSCRK
jgi:hypothetical protein